MSARGGQENGTDYKAVRDLVSQSGQDSRIEVNQRALIDKILARYASPGAVYRELLQNSNDANATNCEIHFTTNTIDSKRLVKNVTYSNDGMPFRKQDWNRLKKIAEGNPDSDKVGFFGVGAYAMFSICEEPMIVSGDEALVFAWKGDALWAKVGKSPEKPTKWTSFVLPARDPYKLPNMKEFGCFIIGNLTFLNSLKSVSVYVDGVSVLQVQRSIVKAAVAVKTPKSTSWWSNDGAILETPKGFFKIDDKDGAITETIIGLRVKMGAQEASSEARLLSSKASVNLNSDMTRKIERVTKKLPPKTVKLQIVIGGNQNKNARGASGSESSESAAQQIVESFSPRLGSGRIFIGFKTSQSTGLGVHFSAPLIPTVEREAIDLIDPTLFKYNCEMLHAGGILMRLGLEHVMASVDTMWKNESEERKQYELREESKAEEKDRKTSAAEKIVSDEAASNSAAPASASSAQKENSGGLFGFGFTKFMASGFKKIADLATTVDLTGRNNMEDSLLNPKETRPLSKAEITATILMRCFSPEKSTPDGKVGQLLAKGFEDCLPNLTPPVLTQSGVRRGAESLLPFLGMQAFTKDNVVRSTVLANAENYLFYVARVPNLTLKNMAAALKDTVLEEKELIRLLTWWTIFAKRELAPQQLQSASRMLKNSIKFSLQPLTSSNANVNDTGKENGTKILELRGFTAYSSDKYTPLNLPHPSFVLPRRLLEIVPMHVLEDQGLAYWFEPLRFHVWLPFIASHPCMKKFSADPKTNLSVLKHIQKEFDNSRGVNRQKMVEAIRELFSNLYSLPHEGATQVLLRPVDLYLPSAEIEIFSEANMRKVSDKVIKEGIRDELLKAFGVRETVSMDILFTQIDSLKWNENPLPLVRFLRHSKLKHSDIQKLRVNRYLPAAGGEKDLFAPSDLCLPRKGLADLGFVRVLQWPEDSDAREHTPDGKFLISLGCRVVPPLEEILKHISKRTEPSDELRDKCLNFLTKNSWRNGLYIEEMKNKNKFADIAFLPTTFYSVFCSKEKKSFGLRASSDCFYEADCAILGFPVVEDKYKILAQRFDVTPHPSWDSIFQKITMYAKHTKPNNALPLESIRAYFWEIFAFLSSRTALMDRSMIAKFQSAAIIPILGKDNSGLQWKTSSQVFFKAKNDKSSPVASSELFDFVDDNAFLRFLGVKDEPGPQEICSLIIRNPKDIFEKCGQEGYKALLKRLSSSYQTLSRESITSLKRSRCLLALENVDPAQKTAIETSASDSTDDTGNNTTPTNQDVVASLEKADAISIVDDAFLLRIFRPKFAPIESDLEEFYLVLGSKYISNRVQTYHQVSGNVRRKSANAATLQKRLIERIPLIVAPNVTHRPLVQNASSILNAKKIEVVEADNILAVYQLGDQRRSQSVSCCSNKTLQRSQFSNSSGITFVITGEIDYFDVGSTICNLILSRSHLEDKFLFGTLLEAPLTQLRARGFPVDRIIRVREAAKPKPPPQPVQQPVRQQEPTVNHGRIIQRDLSRPSLNGNTDSEGKTGSSSSDQDHIKQLLKEDTSKEKLLNVNNILERRRYPKKSGGFSSPGLKPQVTRSNRLKNSLTKMVPKLMKGLSDLPPPSQPPPSTGNGSFRPSNPDVTGPRTVKNEKQNYKNLGQTLENSINTSSSITPSGVKSSAYTAPIVPEFKQTASCEVVEGKNLKPAERKKTKNGLLVFEAQRIEGSSFNLLEHWQSIEKFAVVLENLAGVFSMPMKSIAVYYDPAGNTIAFNRANALYFNVRFFIKLHDINNNAFTMDTFSYWFVVFCHELAHNLQKNHGKEHAYYTESFCQKYQPLLFRNVFSKLSQG